MISRSDRRTLLQSQTEIFSCVQITLRCRSSSFVGLGQSSRVHDMNLLGSELWRSVGDSTTAWSEREEEEKETRGSIGCFSEEPLGEGDLSRRE